MKMFLAVVVLAVGACSALPARSSSDQTGSRGVYFVLPPAPAAQIQQQISPGQVEEIMSQLRQEEGSDSGVYHIVLPDGRLQRVEYTTAPLKQQNERSEQQVAPAEDQPAGPAALVAQPYKAVKEAPVEPAPAQQDKPSGPAALIAQTRAQSQEHINIARLGADGRLYLVASEAAEDDEEVAQVNEQPQKAAKYVASIQYSEVQPITGPIYSYNSQPLTRIVRYAPLI